MPAIQIKTRVINFSDANPGLRITSQVAAGKPLVINGAASQSGNLAEWQNSAGTILALVGADGEVRGSALTIKPGNRSYVVGAYDPGGSMTFTRSDVVSGGMYFTPGGGSTYGDLNRFVSMAGGFAVSAYNGILNFSVGESGIGGTIVFGKRSSDGIVMPNNHEFYGGTVTINPASSTGKGLIIKGAASQAGNLQEWQDSAGAILCSVSSAGAITSAGDLTFTGTTAKTIKLADAGDVHDVHLTIQANTTNGAGWRAGDLILKAGNNTNAGSGAGIPGDVVIRAGQGTASGLHGGIVLQDGAGTARLTMAANGDFTFAGGVTINGTLGNMASDITLTSASARTITMTDAGDTHDKHLTIKAADSNGNGWRPGDLYLKGGINSNVLSTTVTGGDVILQPGTSAGGGGDTQIINSVGTERVRVKDTGEVLVTIPVASYKGGVIKAAASQSGNLQEWQDSSGNPLSTISENGYFTTRKNSAPADAELANGEMALWFDSTNGAAKLMIKAKQADGTVRTGSVALT